MTSFRLKPWIVPGIMFIFLVTVAVITTVFHNQTENYHEAEKSRQIANAISKNMSREIEYRLQALKVFSASVHKPPTDKEFEASANFLRSEYSGFFAINFISTDGVIRKVFPYEDNKAALGRNLLERNDVKNYLIDSKADGQPRSSHRILTYQSIYAIVLYVPLYNNSKKFFGWMNGVLYIDNCLNNYMKDKNLENVVARVRWHHPAETNVLEYKWNYPTKFDTFTYTIMNQTLSIDLAIGKSQVDINRTKSFYLTIALRILLIISITLLLLFLTLSKIRLERTNQKLFLKNNLLNSLSHDLATPLTSLHLTLDSAVHKGELTTSKAEVFDLLTTIKQMMKSVRLLHSSESGFKILPNEKVLLQKAVNDAVNLVDRIARAKKVKFDISPSLDANLFIKANAHTLVNNVLINAFSNAIKFSPVDGTVKVNYTLQGNYINLTITDMGKGLSQQELEKFNLTFSIQSSEGTAGEIGTGLGLLQICGFMKIYGGSVKLNNVEPTGTRLTLSFESA